MKTKNLKNRKYSVEEVVRELKTYANKKNIVGMARFGIRGKNILGGPNIPTLRKISKRIGIDHKLALGLWKSGIHEAKILCSYIDDPRLVTSAQMDAWVKDFESWDICDQVCSNLFDKTEFVLDKINKWTKDEREFVRRAGFVLMATSAVHNKKVSNKFFVNFFPLLEKYSIDERNFVKKAVNWAIRQIGKRNEVLRKKAIIFSKKLLKIDSKSAKWIASDAIRELLRHVF